MRWVLPKHLEVLIVNQDLQISEATVGATRFADSPALLAVGSDCREAFPEMFGLEDILADVIAGHREEFDIKSIARTTADGTLWYFDIYFVRHPENIESQKKYALILFLEEVSERMRLEQTLVQATNETNLLLGTLALAKENIDKIIASMAEALLIIAETGVIKQVNQAAQNLLGYSEAELTEQPLSFITTEDQEIKTLLDKFSANNRGTTEWEVMCRKKSGEKIVISFSRSLIKTEIKGASGQRDTLQEFVYIGRDVTEQKRKQKRLAAQHTASQILSESISVDDVLSKILQAFGRILAWQTGELWMTDPEAPTKIYCSEVWIAPSLQPILPQNVQNNSVCLNFTPGVCLPELVCAKGEPQWFTDITQHPDLVYPHTAETAGLHTAFSFPIQTDKHVLGVITFFSQEIVQVDEDWLQVAATLGNQLGQYIQRKRAESALQLEREKTEQLLLNILPEPIAERLKRDTCTIAEQFSDVSVLFADLVGFTEMASTLSPIELVELLNEIFSEFDELTGKHGLEKIKTIGDAYMVVAGLPRPNKMHAVAMAEMALDMQESVTCFNKRNHKHLSVRIGIHSGSVVAGVIGLKKFIYDLWGDTVNTASRMESHGIADCVQVSSTTYELLKEHYLFEKRGVIPIKGKGTMATYLLVGKPTTLYHQPD